MDSENTKRGNIASLDNDGMKKEFKETKIKEHFKKFYKRINMEIRISFG